MYDCTVCGSIRVRGDMKVWSPISARILQPRSHSTAPEHPLPSCSNHCKTCAFTCFNAVLSAAASAPYWLLTLTGKTYRFNIISKTSIEVGNPTFLPFGDGVSHRQGGPVQQMSNKNVTESIFYCHTYATMLLLLLHPAQTISISNVLTTIRISDSTGLVGYPCGNGAQAACVTTHKIPQNRQIARESEAKASWWKPARLDSGIG